MISSVCLFVCLQSSVDGFQDITFEFCVMVDTNSSKVKVTPFGGSCSLSALVGVAVAEEVERVIY